MNLSTFVITMLVLSVAYGLLVTVVRWVVMLIAARCFGWRPKIYKKALAEEVAEHCLAEVYDAKEKAGHPLAAEDRQDMQEYFQWVIENYTLAYAAKRK